MAIPQRQVQAAYRFLLARDPNVETPPQYETAAQMHLAILRSDEFKSSPRAIKNSLQWPLRQVFVSVPSKVIYCPIGKNACTFLKTQMIQATEDEHLDALLQNVHFLTDAVNSGLQLSDYSQDEVDAFITDPDFLKVAVLRDPMSRLLSAYFEKLVLHRNGPGQIVHTSSVVEPVQKAKGIESPDHESGITFREFVTHIHQQPPHLLDPHWRPQSLYLEGIEYSKLFEFGQINDLIELLEKRSGKALSRQARNVTNSGVGQVVDGAPDLLPAAIIAAGQINKASFFPPDIRKAVEEAYHSDYELLKRHR